MIMIMNILKMPSGNKVPNLTYCPTVLVVRYGLRPGGGGVCWDQLQNCADL